MAVLRVQKVHERRLAHPGRPGGDPGRVRACRRPQPRLEVLVQEERAEFLAGPREIEQVAQAELVVDLQGEACVSDPTGC